MPKVAKKPVKKQIVTLEELNKPVVKRGCPKVKRSISWFRIINLILLTVIAVSSSYIAYELTNASYRISTYKAE